MKTEHTPFTDEGHCSLTALQQKLSQVKLARQPPFREGCVLHAGLKPVWTLRVRSVDFPCTRPRKGRDVKFLMCITNKYWSVNCMRVTLQFVVWQCDNVKMGEKQTRIITSPFPITEHQGFYQSWTKVNSDLRILPELESASKQETYAWIYPSFVLR